MYTACPHRKISPFRTSLQGNLSWDPGSLEVECGSSSSSSKDSEIYLAKEIMVFIGNRV